MRIKIANMKHICIIYKLSNLSNKKVYIGQKGIGKGVSLSKKHRENISKSLLGEKNPFYGKTHNDEVRKIISKANKGKTWKLINGRRVWMEK